MESDDVGAPDEFIVKDNLDEGVSPVPTDTIDNDDVPIFEEEGETTIPSNPDDDGPNYTIEITTPSTTNDEPMEVDFETVDNLKELRITIDDGPTQTIPVRHHFIQV